MAIPTLLSLVGLSESQIAATATLAVPLAEAFKIARGATPNAGTFFRFVNKYVASVPGSTRAAAAAAYRAAKYWASQGQVISAITGDQLIDRRLAQVIPVKQSEYEFDRNYRYYVEIAIHFPGESKPQLFGSYVHDMMLLTPADAIDLAVTQLLERFHPRTRPSQGGGELEGASISARLLNFARYEVQR